MTAAGERNLGVERLVPPRPAGRGRDRRAAFPRLVEAVARRAVSVHDAGLLRAQFEAALRDALGVPRVCLRDGVASLPEAPIGVAGSVRRIAAHVSTPRGAPPAVLEATLTDNDQLDGWDGQVLAVAAHLAAIVLEVERCRARASRHDRVTRRDAAAPPSLVGASPAMGTLRENIARVAETDFVVLIEGESGTGKELVARQIHELSHRRHGPFVAINCAAIVESLLEAELFGIEDHTATGVRGRRGKFELADGGTLFLDEVSDLAPAAQAKLLRAIQELTVERVGGHASRKVDTRIVVATNRSLRDLVTAGQFREDLYYRLSGVELHVPPLRARRQDIPDLCAHFLSRYQAPRPIVLSAEAVEVMQIYDWPGNVRELERTIEGAVTLGADAVIGITDLPRPLRGDCAEALRESLERRDSMRAWGARYARLMYARCDRNKRRACEVLDISYHTLMAYLHWKPAGGPWPDGPAGACPSREPAAPKRTLEQTLCG